MTGFAERLRALLADPAVRWLATARLIPLVAAPVSLYFLVRYQGAAVRGFYLIAINVAMLAQLFETGMGTLVVQFAARARPVDRGTVRGAAEQWYLRTALVTLALGATVGTYLFARAAGPEHVSFLVPWSIVLACTAAYVRIAPLVCLREGAGDVDGVQRMRAVQAVAITVVILLGLRQGRGLATAAAAAVAQLAAAALYLWMVRRSLPARDAPAGRVATQFRTEQAKSARVWIALWAAPQILTPATMFTRGAVESGSIGVHVALAFAPPLVALAWMHARYPRMGALVASGALRTFDETAMHAFRQAAAVFGAMSAAVLSLPLVLPWLLPALPARLLSAAILGLLLAGNFAIVAFQAMLAWMRAFGDERFATPVVLACAAMAIGGVGGAALGGASGAAGGFALVGGAVTPILVIGFRRLRVQRLAAGQA